MPDRHSQQISLWFKVPYTLFVCVLIPVYWVEYGPSNFLWASDIALFVSMVAAWTSNRLLVSMMALGAVLPELAWNVDFFCRLLLGAETCPLPGTPYMFDAGIPLFVRLLSLFHVALPVILIWLVYRLRYDPRALYFQTLLAWVILPVTYLFTNPAKNINGVFGIGPEPQTWMPGSMYVGLLMVLFPLVVYLPMHLLFKRLFSASYRS